MKNHILMAEAVVAALAIPFAANNVRRSLADNSQARQRLALQSYDADRERWAEAMQPLCRLRTVMVSPSG
jgi:hypothetical protein